MDAKRKGLVMEVFKHDKPLWGAEADHHLLLKVNDEVFSQEYEYEDIAAKHVLGRQYKICAVPLFVKGFCLGDIVEVDDDNTVISLVTASQRHGFRVYIPAENDDATANYTLVKKIVEKLGGSIEPNTEFYFGIDAENKETAQNISSQLLELEKSNFIEYDTART